jgi:outer membrane lipoprotein-sorting protein
LIAKVRPRTAALEVQRALVNVFRRLPISRLLLLCATILAAGISITAIAFALGTGSKPPAKPLAQAVHDALAASRPAGFSADVKLTNHLLEGADLASGDGEAGIASNPLLTGASGRLWVARDGRVRLELQAEGGDTQILYDGHSGEVYDAAKNTLYRLTPSHEGNYGEQTSRTVSPDGSTSIESRVVPDRTQPDGTAPSVAKIEEAIAHVDKHSQLSGATPANVGGQPAYTVRIAPRTGGSLIGGVELSFDAANGTPLRAAIYSTQSSSPVIELAASNVSYGTVADSVFAFSLPPNAKIVELGKSARAGGSHSRGHSEHPRLSSHGKGLSTIGVLEAHESGSAKGESGELEALPKVTINGIKATELQTELGTLLSFERGGVRYVLAGAVAPAAVEALARGL